MILPRVPRTSKEKSKSQTEEVKAEQIENILETNIEDILHKMTTKSNVQKASTGLKVSKVKAPKKESTAEVTTEEMAPPPGELRRRFSEDSISSEASMSSDSSSKLRRTHMILLDTGLKHVKPHQVVHVGQEAIINLDEVSSASETRGRTRESRSRTRECRSISRNRESSLVRQRAAQWKEKETGNPNAKLPIPVQTGRRDKSRSRDSHR